MTPILQRVAFREEPNEFTADLGIPFPKSAPLPIAPASFAQNSGISPALRRPLNLMVQKQLSKFHHLIAKKRPDRVHHYPLAMDLQAPWVS